MTVVDANGASSVSDGPVQTDGPSQHSPSKKQKLHGRAFYESIGSPKLIVAPMVDRSEFAWRMLTRSFTEAPLLAYSPMFHARLFRENEGYRQAHFEALRPAPTSSSLNSAPSSSSTSLPSSSTPSASTPHLDGNPTLDRPFIVQFCANEPADLLAAAKHVEPFVDAVDLNLGCPQGIARRGRYGAFLQEEPELIHSLIRTLHENLDVPVTAKFRIRETREETLKYARLLLDAGASILAVHGRTREQKGHNTGVADWEVIRYLREMLPADTVLFANGNVLGREDVEACLNATGVDGVMSAEGCLSDPTIFAGPPPQHILDALEGGSGDSVAEVSESYWRGRDGRGGYRMDFILRRYLDIIYEFVLGLEKPTRKPLFVPGRTQDEIEPQSESAPVVEHTSTSEAKDKEDDNEPHEPPTKKQKRRAERKERQKQKNSTKRVSSPNLSAMQGHLFQLLRPLVSARTNVRDALARSRAGDIDAFENVLGLVEAAVRDGMKGYEAAPEEFEVGAKGDEKLTGSSATIAKYARPWWVCQPHIRPLPEEALQSGAMQLSKSEKRKLEMEAVKKRDQEQQQEERKADEPNGRGVQGKNDANGVSKEIGTPRGELERDAMLPGPRPARAAGLDMPAEVLDSEWEDSAK